MEKLMGRSNEMVIAGLYRDPISLEAVFDEIPLPVVFLSTGKRVVYQNRAAEALTGYSSDEARGLPCAHVLRSSLCGSRCPLARSASKDGASNLEADIITRDRRKIPVQMSLSPVTYPGGEPAGYLEVIENLEVKGKWNREISGAFSVGEIVGRSPVMEKLFAMLPGIAQTDSSVLITGETGTGKDLLAEVIHRMSSRAKGPFVKVNCGALPETLLESELFGHVKGAFTGATQNKPGWFRLAHNGTLFLAEIGDIPPSVQVKLLTFLDDHVIYPLGSTSGVRVDVRIIAATHRDLSRMVREGRFREDLLFRLNVVRLHVPPLREREGDVRLLLDHFLHSFSSRFGKRVTRFSRNALRILLEYPYPGNVRELKNIVEYGVNVTQGDTVDVEHIPAYVVEAAGKEKAVDHGSPPEVESPSPLLSMNHEASAGGTFHWEEVEKRMILDALVKCGGRRARAAKMLGWGRATLWRKMKHYGIS